MIQLIEILAVIFGLIQGVLVMLNKKSNWIFYIVQMILMVAFSWMNNLWGDVALNVWFVIQGVIGMIMWNKEADVPVTMYTPKEWGKWGFGSLMLFAVLAAVLTCTNDPVPMMDAFTTTGALVATYMMAKKKLETWVIWFIIDIAYVIQYFMLPDQAWYLMGLNVIWTGMAVASFINWKRLMNKTV